MKYDSHFRRRTKIVCTIGPASDSAHLIERLIRAGMNVSRHNLSHGNEEEHIRDIETVRNLARRLGIPVAILMDLPGPKYRTGRLSGGSAVLKKGAFLTLTTRQVEGNEELVSVNMPTLPQDVKAHDTVLVDDGAIQLSVQSVKGSEVRCRVVGGGVLTLNRGLVVPGRHISAPFLTEELRRDIRFACKQNPDFIALSFVGKPEDLVQARALLNQQGCDAPVIVKVERGQAVAHFDQILNISDGIMVARGDLGVDIPIQRIPLVQKEIIRKCNRAGKPVITATQMLESMVEANRPTRAEVTDVANAIFDGTDAIMLSEETSVGKYPVQAVRMMSQVAKEAEARLPYEHMLLERSAWLERQTDELISYEACHMAQRLGAKAIVAFTHSGSTARRVSKYRPSKPILAITTSEHISRRLLLCWGVQPLGMAKPTTVDDFFAMGAELSKGLGMAKAGDLIVVTGGIPIGVSGTTNLLKVERIT
ncbi:pyruvate kinase [Chloroflexota bacterium]